MFTAIALLVELVGLSRAPMPQVCELSIAVPGKTSTRSCMGCHDGTIGPAARVSFPSTLEGFWSAPGGKGSGSHPVDIDYEQSWQRRPGSLVPLAALPRELVLQDGRITCVTCHLPGSPERFRVAVSMDRSALCLACHRY